MKSVCIHKFSCFQTFLYMNITSFLSIFLFPDKWHTSSSIILSQASFFRLVYETLFFFLHLEIYFYSLRNQERCSFSLNSYGNYFPSKGNGYNFLLPLPFSFIVCNYQKENELKRELYNLVESPFRRIQLKIMRYIWIKKKNSGQYGICFSLEEFWKYIDIIRKMWYRMWC